VDPSCENENAPFVTGTGGENVTTDVSHDAVRSALFWIVNSRGRSDPSSGNPHHVPLKSNDAGTAYV